MLLLVCSDSQRNIIITSQRVITQALLLIKRIGLLKYKSSHLYSLTQLILLLFFTNFANQKKQLPIKRQLSKKVILVIINPRRKIKYSLVKMKLLIYKHLFWKAMLGVKKTSRKIKHSPVIKKFLLKKKKLWVKKITWKKRHLMNSLFKRFVSLILAHFKGIIRIKQLFSSIKMATITKSEYDLLQTRKIAKYNWRHVAF